MDAPRVYVCAWALCYFQKDPNLPEGADSVGGQLRGDKECPLSDVTNSARVWRTKQQDSTSRFHQFAVRHLVSQGSPAGEGSND